MELKDIKGVGPKRLALFSKLHIESIEDLLEFFPCGYLDYSVLTPISELRDGELSSVEICLTGKPSFYSRRGMTVITLYGKDRSGKKLALRWFNQPYRAGQYQESQRWFAAGKVKKGEKGPVALINPVLTREQAGIQPVYSTPKGLPGKLISQCVAIALDTISVQETIPEQLCRRYDLISRAEEIRILHFPSDRPTLERALARYTFEEALYYFLYLESCREVGMRTAGRSLSCPGALSAFIQSRPFALTKAQKRVLEDVEKDMAGPYAMNRLIQGDVGAGKTVIAQYALYLAARCGSQGAFLAPTELLARQQYETLRKDFGARCGLLTGSLSGKERQQALDALRSGRWQAVAGTHALFSDDVVFKDLGVIVTDEQHRFGVEQRARMMDKGFHPHVLVMSATPIPRTLALMLYGDLELSAVDEMPPGRLTVKTHLVSQNKRAELIRYLGNEAAMDHRSYVVCPLIEKTEGYEGLSVEEVAEEFANALPGVSIGCLHGRMEEQEKQCVMEAFRKGEISILIATTVIEVGIHVPEALHMTIIGAERFGLSSLHQLRGRVGRGEGQAHCFLLCTKVQQNSMARLQAMLDTNDGFEIANRDMALRGTGDLLGIRQSGESRLEAFLREGSLALVEKAHAAAREIMREPYEAYNELLKESNRRYGQGRRIALN